jgi:3-oxoacyl-[acyl-carrier protein] reductase
MFDLRERIVLITGAGSGIGRATAVMLAAHGAHVLAVDLNDRGLDTATAITAAGDKAEGFVLDVSDRSAVDDLTAQLLARFGRIDGLVTSAGIMCDDSIAELEEATLDKVLAINLKGTLWCCKAAAAAMVLQRSGSIVTLSSTVADRPAPRTAAYAMSKAAIVQFTKVLALEVAEAGVRVNAVAPGVVLSGITERHYTNPDGSIDEVKRQTVLARLASYSPLGQVGEPDDVANIILYLISDASKFMTGQVLRPNGGAAMP